MEKSLFIITHDYPLAKGDAAFIENEINFLSVKFEKVTILCLNNDCADTIPMPENCRVFFAPIPNYRTLKFCSILLTPTFRNHIDLFHEELRDLSQRKKTSLINRVLALRYYIKASYILDQINKVEMLVGEHDLLYTFWYDAETLASIMCSHTHTCTRTHRYDLYEERSKHNYLPFRQVMDRRIKAINFISREGMDYYIKKFSTENLNKYHLCYLGTTPRIKDERTNIDGKSLNLLSLSYVIPVKQINVIVKALSVLSSDVTVNWTHIGDGEAFEEINNLCNNLLDGKVNIFYSLAGFKTHTEAMKIMEEGSFHCFINSSASEGLPVSMMEAMSVGIPVIGPNVGGISEIVDESNGILLPADSTPEDYARAIEHIYHMKEEDYMAMREAAYNKWDAQFNADKNYQRYSKLLYELAE